MLPAIHGRVGRALDTVGVVTALPELPPSDGRPELVVLRAIKLGDILIAVPALHALRRAYPGHRITLATTAWLAPIVELLPVDLHLAQQGLDHDMPIVPGTVDVAVNLHGSGGESRSIVEHLRARHVIKHAAPGEEGLPWVDGMHERERWIRLLDAFGVPGDPDEVSIAVPAVGPAVRNATVIHVGAFYGARHWPVERFADVARSLADRGHHVVVSGGAADVERATAVAEGAGLPPESVVAGTLDLQEFAAVIADAHAVVTVDTGAAHLASAYGIPSVVLFGPAPPEEWGPPATGPHVVLTDASVRLGETFAEEPDPALLAVTAQDVLGAVEDVTRVGTASAQ